MFRRDRLGRRNSGLEHVERRVLEMLDVDRHTLDLATSGLLGSANPEALRSAVSDSDHGVNLLVQQVRRELVVHASVRGSQADIPAMLATMSIIKDIERIGDYAKQLLRLARVRGPFAPDTAEHVELTAYGNRIAGHVSDVRGALATHDGPAAAALIIDLRALAHPAGPDAAAVGSIGGFASGEAEQRRITWGCWTPCLPPGRRCERGRDFWS